MINKSHKFIIIIVIIFLNCHSKENESFNNKLKDQKIICLLKENKRFIKAYSKKDWKKVYEILSDSYRKGLYGKRPILMDDFIMEQEEIYYAGNIKLKMMSYEIKNDTAKTYLIVKGNISKTSQYTVSDTLLCFWIYLKGKWYLRYL